MDNTASGAAQKALKFNLDAITYGTFAEIGAGQIHALGRRKHTFLRSLCAEQNGASGEALGHFPQALTHPDLDWRGLQPRTGRWGLHASRPLVEAVARPRQTAQFAASRAQNFST